MFINNLKSKLIHLCFLFQKENRLHCKICMKQFTDKSNKYRHMRQQHKDHVKKQKCLTCNQLFCTLDSVKRHSRRQHDGILNCEEFWITPEENQMNKNSPPRIVTVDSEATIDDAWVNEIIEEEACDIGA